MKFYSHGKLLISGEYLVLKGALALAAPLNFGQSLDVFETKKNEGLLWESYVQNNLWFKAIFDGNTLEMLETSNKMIASKLSYYLSETKKLNPDFLKSARNTAVKTSADFDINWGLGSSSTLISNIAYWANVDQFVLHNALFSGSGYDVICARQSSPILFELTNQSYSIDTVSFNPSFNDNIFFAYLGNKQDSVKSVAEFNSKKKSYKNEIRLVSDLSRHIAFATDLKDFEYYIKEHEDIMASILMETRIKEKRFADFEGEMKSLGAWGGDFAMLTWTGTKMELQSYLKKKGIDVFFSYNEIIRTS